MSLALSLRDVTLGYSGTKVLDGLSLKVAAGETVAMLGPSGAGKSSLLRVLLGFVAPDRGTVSIGGSVVSQNGRVLRPPEDRNLAVVFQDLALWPHMTVEGNLAFGLRSRGTRGTEVHGRVVRALDQVGLPDLGARYPGQLSGGEQQRVAIARALVLEPDAILLDEPMSNLDLGLRQDLLELFESLFREAETTVVHVTHDPWEAQRLGASLAIIERGTLAYRGAIADIPPEHESLFVRQVGRRFGP